MWRIQSLTVVKKTIVWHNINTKEILKLKVNLKSIFTRIFQLKGTSIFHITFLGKIASQHYPENALKVQLMYLWDIDVSSVTAKSPFS